MKSMDTEFATERTNSDHDGQASNETFDMHEHNDKLAIIPADRRRMERRHSWIFKRSSTSFPWRTIAIVLSVPLALSLIVTLAAAAEMVSQQYILGRDCYPNGMWKEQPGATWRIMDSSYFFTPNLSFGTFTFTQVKVVDIAWDLIVGRGGQMLLAWVNYRVFNEWLVYHMEMHLTSYKMYAAVAFETTTLGTLGVLAKEFLNFGKGTWRRFFRWLAVLSMLLSTAYVLSFPTLMAAMTGYITTSEPYVEDYEHNLIEWSQIREVVYVVHDITRLVDYDRSPLVVTSDDEALMEAVKDYISQFKNHGVQYHKEHGPGIGSFYVANETSEFNPSGQGQSIQLPAPSLNITEYDSQFLQTSSLGNEPYVHDIPRPEVRADRFAFAFERAGNTLYNTTYLREKGSCKPSEEYQWGFSYIFLFMVSIFNFIWTCIMVGMWLDTRRASRMYKNGRRPGLLRSIMDYSAAVREELGAEAEFLEEDELRERVRDSGGALIVPKTELRVRRVDNLGIGDRKGSWKRSLTSGSTF